MAKDLVVSSTGDSPRVIPRILLLARKSKNNCGMDFIKFKEDILNEIDMIRIH
jgi:hypothetical protein